MANHEAAVRRARGSESQIAESVAQSEAVRVATNLASLPYAEGADVARDLAVVVDHMRDKITTAAYVLECVERGEEVDEEVQGLARGAMRDLRDLRKVFDALRRRK